MRPIARDLAAVRREHERLWRRIVRFRLLRLLVLVLLVAGVARSVARGLHRADTAELRDLRTDIARLNARLGTDAVPISRSEDPFGYRGDFYTDSGIPVLPKAGPPPHDEVEKKQLWEEVRSKKGNLNSIYTNAFSRQVELGAVRLDLYIPDWPVLFPAVFFLFVLSSVYVHILRKKRQLIVLVAAHQLKSQSEVGNAPDRLCFSSGRDPAGFSQHPAQYAEWLERVAVLLLLMVLCAVFAAVRNWQILGDSMPWVGVFGTAALYLAIYGRSVSKKLEAQVASATGLIVRPTWVARAGELGRRWAQQNFFRRRPRASLVAGAVLFNYINRLANALGVDPEVEMQEAWQRWRKAKATPHA